jgi:hypothetical protein
MKPTIGSGTSSFARTLMRTRIFDEGSSVDSGRPISSNTAMPMTRARSSPKR